MNKNYIIPALVIGLLGTISFQTSDSIKIEKYVAKKGHIYANGAPTGRTGAPGEGNCTGCHGGMTESGVAENLFTLLNGATPVSFYETSTVYNVALAMSSAPTKKGFQAIALGSSNTNAGSFTGVAGNTTITTAGSKMYANHTGTSNTNAVSTWTWTWTSPATDMGDVTFYVATNKANGNMQSSGDVIYLSEHLITSTLGTVEQVNEETAFSAGYSADKNSIVINFSSLSLGDMNLNLVDMNGRSVFLYNLGNAQIGENKQTVALPAHIENGIYIVNFFVNNRAMSAKIMVQK